MIQPFELCEIQHRRFARNLLKLLIAALQDKKKLQRRDEWKLRFKQLQLNYINNYQKQKREDIKLVTVSSGVDVVVKIDDEVYVLSIIKLYCYFSFVFCCAKEGRVVENNQSNVATFKILG